MSEADAATAAADAEADKLWADRYWTRFYREGVPKTIDAELDAAGSMVDLFTRDATQFADREGFVSLGTGITYGEALADAQAFGAWLQSIGVKQGERVALMMPNCLQYPIALFGTLMIGGIVVNVNPLYSARELRHQLDDSGAVTIVVMDLFAATLDEVRGDLPKLRHVVVTGMGAMLGPAKGSAITLAMRSQVKKWKLPGAHRWRAVMKRARKLTLKPAEIAQGDTAFLQYTGGTSGVAKGAILTHRNVVANALQGRAWVLDQLTLVLEKLGPGEKLTNITLLPLYHIFSLTANLLMFIGAGGRNVLIANPRDTKRVEWILRKEKFAGFTGVNTLFANLLDNQAFRNRDFSALQVTIAGGMATHPSIAKEWQEVTGRPLVEGYGLTECSPVVCISPVDLTKPETMKHSGRVGLPVPSTEVRMRRDDGSWAGIDEVGELCVRGPQVMAGYWNRPTETQQVLIADGWLRTGDIGLMDAEGQVRLVDRLKDLIVVSGFNVYPSEVEAVLAAHPAIREVGVIGVPDRKSGEVVKAVVQSTDPALKEADVIAFARKSLAGYKVPRIVEVREGELPKSDVGKVLRRKLRDEHDAR